MGTTSHETASIHRDVILACRRRRRRLKLADSTGAALTGGNLLLRALVLRGLLRRLILRPDERNVGVLLPPTVAAAATNLALALDGRVAVNLNYTLTAEMLNDWIAQAGIRHVLTSRQFMERVPLQLDAAMVCLEDLRDQPTLRDKLAGAVQAHVLPVDLLLRLLGRQRASADDPLLIMFTSGSTSDAKGAVLTCGNVAFDLNAVNQAIRLRPDDVLVGVLPFFHAFGSVVTLWAGMCLDLAVVYHPNPLDARGVGKLCRERHGTILLATPMFLRQYERRCEPEEFASLEVVITGGEALPPSLADAFEARFGQRPVEGYGCTEAAALISANVPAARAMVGPRLAGREGTVGRPLPGIAVQVRDLETDAVLPPGEQGMLWVSGPNVMAGYLDRPEATAAVIRDGWYKTGDVVIVDDDGFIRIVGRESRFAKIGGEMVSHTLVEAALTNLVGLDENGGSKVVVVSTPDPAKGERLVVVHTGLPLDTTALRRGLAAAGLPNIFIPAADSFIEIAQLPVVGTGKLDLKQVVAIAAAGRPHPVAARPPSPRIGRGFHDDSPTMRTEGTPPSPRIGRGGLGGEG